MPLFRNLSPIRLAFIFIALITCFRLWYLTQPGLVADEAYYWLWSKHLALSYRDKGPLVAWLIWMGTKLFGNTVFGIRVVGVLLSSATGLLIFQLARRLYDDRTGLWCMLVALVIPEMAIGSILMTIDTPSVFFWAMAALLFWEGLHNDKISTWFWLGLAIGAGFLAKFTNGVQLIGIGFFLLWNKEHRRLLISWKTVVMSAGFLLASIPIFVWNIQTGWVHLMALHSRSGVTNKFGVHPKQLLRFIGEQAGVISPFIMIGMVVAAVALLLNRRSEIRVRFLLSQFLPIYAVFTFFALNKAGQPNWTVPALVTGIIFTVYFWRDLMARYPGWKPVVITAYALTAIGAVVLHGLLYLPLPQKYNPMRRAQGWPDFAAHVQKARTEQNAGVLLGADYSLASLMAFYLPDQPTTYMAPEPYGSTQFTLWPTYEVTTNTRALYVTWDIEDSQHQPKSLQKQFANIKLLEEFWTQDRGRPTKHVCIYLCTR